MLAPRGGIGKGLAEAGLGLVSRVEMSEEICLRVGCHD